MAQNNRPIVGRFRCSWRPWQRWRASMAFFMLPAYKLPAVIQAACAGSYGRKNTRGYFPRAFLFCNFQEFRQDRQRQQQYKNDKQFVFPLYQIKL
jgi:hypothetical protein